MTVVSLAERVRQAALKIDKLFYVGEKPPIPEGATREELWDEILRLKKMFKPPKKQDVIRLLLEDPDMVDLSIPLMADLMCQVYASHGVKCNTSEGAIRWHISQFTLEWDIKPRSKAAELE